MEHIRSSEPRTDKLRILALCRAARDDALESTASVTQHDQWKPSTRNAPVAVAIKLNLKI